MIRKVLTLSALVLFLIFLIGCAQKGKIETNQQSQQQEVKQEETPSDDLSIEPQEDELNDELLGPELDSLDSDLSNIDW